LCFEQINDDDDDEEGNDEGDDAVFWQAVTGSSPTAVEESLQRTSSPSSTLQLSRLSPAAVQPSLPVTESTSLV